MNLTINRIAFLTILRKEVVRILRIWPQTLLPATITMSLYFLVFGNLLGPRIKSIQNIPYINFIIPGIIMMSIITNSYNNVVSSFFSAKFQRHVEEMLVAPINHFIIIMGFVLGGVFRGILIGCIITCVSLLFAKIHLYNIYIVILTGALTSLLFSLAGFLNGLFAKKFDDINIFTTFFLSPLTYLGGVFYSIKLLPEFWYKISLFNPILYMISAFRYGFLGTSDVPLSIALIMMTMCIIVLGLTCIILMRAGYALKS